MREKSGSFKLKKVAHKPPFFIPYSNIFLTYTLFFNLGSAILHQVGFNESV